MSRPYRRRAVLSIIRAYSHDPLERIDTIAGVGPDRKRWTLSQVAAVASIEAGTDEFFINAADGQVVKLVVFTSQGQKYLRSEREKTHPDDLFSLLAQ